MEMVSPGRADGGDRNGGHTGLPVRVMRWSRSKYGPRLNVPKAQRKALKEMVEKYGRPAQ